MTKCHSCEITYLFEGNYYCSKCNHGMGITYYHAMQRAEKAEATIKSIATMLGWINVPSQDVLEREIAELKRKIQTQKQGVTITH